MLQSEGSQGLQYFTWIDICNNCVLSYVLFRVMLIVLIKTMVGYSES